MKEILINKKNRAILKEFEEYFSSFNEHTNLVSKNDRINFFEKHIKDSLALSLVFEKYYVNKSSCSILDIGTGGGFPAIPVALCYKDYTISAVDSVKKKINFIESVKIRYNLENLNPICSRIESLPLNLKKSFDLCTSRALARLNILLEYAIPYLKVGGLFVGYKSKLVDEEISASQNALKILNCEIIDIIHYKLEDCNNLERNLVIIKKIKETNQKYPRKNGMITKNPL